MLLIIYTKSTLHSGFYSRGESITCVQRSTQASGSNPGLVITGSQKQGHQWANLFLKKYSKEIAIEASPENLMTTT